MYIVDLQIRADKQVSVDIGWQLCNDTLMNCKKLSS